MSSEGTGIKNTISLDAHLHLKVYNDRDSFANWTKTPSYVPISWRQQLHLIVTTRHRAYRASEDQGKAVL